MSCPSLLLCVLPDFPSQRFKELLADQAVQDSVLVYRVNLGDQIEQIFELIKVIPRPGEPGGALSLASGKSFVLDVEKLCVSADAFPRCPIGFPLM